jgi:hypothetical protein
MPRKFDGEEPLTSFDPASVPNIASSSSTPGGRGVGGGRGGFGGFGDATAGGPSLGSPTGGTAGGSSRAGGGAGGPDVGYPTTAQSGGPSGPYGPGGPAAGSGASGQGGAGGQAGSAGASGGAPPAGAAQLGGMSAGGASGSSSGGQAGASPGGSAGGSSAGKPSRGPSQVKSGASRGSNWGLVGAAGRSTGITRPIHVAVLLDRIVVIPEKGDDRPQQHLRVPDRLQDTDIDAVVASVQKEMKAWGLAVEGGYWKPVLEVVVAPDAEHHFADLQTALQNSGFELHRKTP